jgi:hypothetical protein
MSPSDLMTDGSNVLATVIRPASGVSALADRPRAVLALALSTLLTLAAAAAVIPHTDYGGGQVGAKSSDAAPAQEPTEYERDQAASTARKLGEIGDWASAALLPSLAAAVAAGVLVLGFRLAGAKAFFRPALAVTAHGLLPLWLSRVLAIPAALSHAPIPRSDLAWLLPSSPASLLPPGASPALLGALSALDLFGLWAFFLVATGMARATSASRLRSFLVTFVLYLAYVALVRVAVPSWLASPGASPH